ncbi:MAG: phage terminase large subunit [Rhodovibrionaceae bacterium]
MNAGASLCATRDGFVTFVAVWYHLQNLSTPRFHLTIAAWLETRWRAGERELALLAFRSAGKSTLVGLFCAWLLYRDPDLRILVLAADQALAGKMVRNVRRILEQHPFTVLLRPARADQWASDRFTVERGLELRDPSMLARGIAGNITGSRADIVICDDVEVPKTCDTAPKRADLRTKLGEIDYVLVPGGLQLYVGTPHSYYTIYATQARAEIGEQRPFLGGFTRFELPLIDAAGRSAWPERFPEEKVAVIRRRSGPGKFASQMLLQPVDIRDSRLDPDKLRLYDAELVYSEGNRQAQLSLDGRPLASASAWWDPAYGAPGKGDASVVAAVFTDREGRRYLHRIAYLQHDPARIEEVDEASQLCRQVASFLKANHLPAVTIETNGVGRFLPSLLRRELAAVEVPAAVIETVSRRPKAERIIEAFDALLAAGALHAHRQVWETPFILEMREWRPDKAAQARDDGLDAVSGCLLSEPIRLPRKPFAGRQSWRGGIHSALPGSFDI